MTPTPRSLLSLGRAAVVAAGLVATFSVGAAPPAPATWTLHGSAVDGASETGGLEMGEGRSAVRVTYERAATGRTRSYLSVVRVADGCSPKAVDRTGCARAGVALLGDQTRVTFFDLARRKATQVSLAPFGGAEGTSGTLYADGERVDADVRVRRQLLPDGRLSIGLRASLGKRVYEVAGEVGTREPGAVREVVALATVELLQRLVAGESRTPGPVVRSKEEGTTDEPPNPGTDPGRDCPVCDFCEDLPGGETLGGCFGFPGGDGHHGGDDDIPVPTRGPTATPPPTPAPSPTPRPCRLRNDQVAVIFMKTLVDDLGFTFCKTSPTTLPALPEELWVDFDKDYFKAARDVTGLDAESVRCAACFFDANNRFALGPGTSVSTPGLKAVAKILKPKCIRTRTQLKKPANAAELAEVRRIAKSYMDELASCKRLCDTTPPSSPAVPAPHRAFCDCNKGYLGYAPGDHPGDSTCVK